MARKLDVYLYGHLVGTLEQKSTGQLGFRYAPSWLAASSRIPISQSLPLREEPFSNREARPFFAGLLPEAEKRDLVARALGVSARNDFALLDGIGGECAGAVTLVRSGEVPQDNPTEEDYRQLDDDNLARIIDALPDRPLLAGEEGVRLSLAGAQDKLPVLFSDGSVALPLNGAPSTHILKPPIRGYEDTVSNEGFCLALAQTAELHVVASEIRNVKTRPYLLVERYDRVRGSRGVRRLHQEDFCQALGIVPELKYQSEGGPSLQQCFDLVRRSSALPVIDLARLLDAVLFNVLVGNNDAHGKNYSLLVGDAELRVAPTYDVTCTAVYPGLSPSFAMKIGDTYEFLELYPRHWERFAKDTGLGVPQVRRRLVELAQRLPNASRAVAERFAADGLEQPIVKRIIGILDERAGIVLQRFG